MSVLSSLVRIVRNFFAEREESPEEQRNNKFHICRIEELESRDFLSGTPIDNDDIYYEAPENPCDSYIEYSAYQNAVPLQTLSSPQSSSALPGVAYSANLDAAGTSVINNSNNHCYEITNTAALDSLTTFTFAARFNVDSTAGWHYILCHDSENNSGAEVFLRIRDGKLQFGYWDTWENHLAETDVSANTWYNVMATYDGTSWKLYLNGELKDTETYTPANGIGNLDVRSNGVQDAWYVGRHGTSSDQRIFGGTISSVAILNGVLENPGNEWKINIEAEPNLTATERMSSVPQDYAEFSVTRTYAYAGLIEPDWSKQIEVALTLDTTVLHSASAGDFALKYFNSSSQQWEYVPRSGNVYTVTIQAGSEETQLRLLPEFDWEDEAELFDPFNTEGKTAKEDIGEKALFRITHIAWTDKGNWNAFGNDLIAAVEIRDGAFAAVISDVDNDGDIDHDDYMARHGDSGADNNTGTLLLRGTGDNAEYYAWIDELAGSYALMFSGEGGVVCTFESDHIDQNKKVAAGIVEVYGVSDSNIVGGGKVSITVGDFTDWTSYSVFSIMVDMAFNYDRTDNDGSDGLNIRESGTANTERQAPEYRGTTDAAQWQPVPNGDFGKKEVLYLADKDVSVYVRIVTSMQLPNNVEIEIEANAADLAIGGLKKQTVTLNNSGVSTSSAKNNTSKQLAGVDGFVEFEAKSNTFNGINKETGSFTFNVSKIKGKSVETTVAATTDAITVYTVLAAPSGVWDMSDTTLTPDYPYPAADNKMQPWISVLDLLTGNGWCKGITNTAIASSKITEVLYMGGKFRYEPSGPMVYIVNAASSYFNLSSFCNQLTHPNPIPVTVGCADMAWGVAILSNLLGDSLNVMVLTGTTSQSIPNTSPTLETNDIIPIGTNQPVSKTWTYHAVAWRGSQIENNPVYDACLKVFNPATNSWEIPTVMNFSGANSYSSLLAVDPIIAFGFFNHVFMNVGRID